MKSEEIWKYIHSERGQMAETWAELTPGQWAAASWCEGWSVQDTAGHILAAAEQTPANFAACIADSRDASSRWPGNGLP